jgi:hypothetical protein
MTLHVDNDAANLLTLEREGERRSIRQLQLQKYVAQLPMGERICRFPASDQLVHWTPRPP